MSKMVTIEVPEEALERLQALAAVLPIYTSMLTLSSDSDAELHLAVMAMKPDGSGQVGPSWQLAEFVEDLVRVVGEPEDEDEEEDDV